MFSTAFTTPLTVLVGLGLPRKIGGLLDAIRYLDEQPASHRDEAFHVVVEACRDALNSGAPVEEARDLFCALVRRRGFLIEELWNDNAMQPSPIAVPAENVAA